MRGGQALRFVTSWLRLDIRPSLSNCLVEGIPIYVLRPRSTICPDERPICSENDDFRPINLLTITVRCGLVLYSRDKRLTRVWRCKQRCSGDR